MSSSNEHFGYLGMHSSKVRGSQQYDNSIENEMFEFNDQREGKDEKRRRCVRRMREASKAAAPEPPLGRAAT
ncbi:unnamed protein product, partial [Brenthis ino]